MYNGSIVVAGPIPEVSTPSASTMLAFMPSAVTAGKLWLSLDSEGGVARIMDGITPLQSIKIDTKTDLPKGRFEVLLKQHDALWHASDEYFKNRSLPVPDFGSKERFLRGALGDSVLYFSEDLAIHNSLALIPEVGGVCVNDKEMQLLYNHLEVGSIIEIR
jgi:hypothetical protein